MTLLHHSSLCNDCFGTWKFCRDGANNTPVLSSQGWEGRLSAWAQRLSSPASRVFGWDNHHLVACEGHFTFQRHCSLRFPNERLKNQIDLSISPIFFQLEFRSAELLSKYQPGKPKKQQKLVKSKRLYEWNNKWQMWA